MPPSNEDDAEKATFAPEGATGAADFPISAAEYLAAVPHFPALPPSLRGAAPPADRAAELRDARPLDSRALLDGLSAAPALRWITVAQLRVAPFAALARERTVAFIATGIVVNSLPWAFGRDRFGTKQLAVGYATWIALWLCLGIVNPLTAGFRRGLGLKGQSSASRPSLDASPLAGLVRWNQLVADGGTSRLLRHDPDDKLCPCALPGCSGGLLREITILRLLEFAFKLTTVLTVFLCGFWTPTVTLASVVWTSPWAATLAALNTFVLLAYSFPNALCRFTGNVGIFRLSERVSHRAMKLALEDLLHRLSSGAANPSTPISDEPHAQLHAVFTAAWRTRVSAFHTSGSVLFAAAICVVMAGINMISGSCVPSFYIAYLLYVLLSLSLFDLLSLAASNAQVTSLVDLYLDARREIRELPLPASPALAADLRRHDAALSSYADAARSRGRFLGFAVDYGVVRTVYATALTLAVGIWSVLRGLGVVATMDIACGG
ncbi:hypothetical protein DFJ74DRAFT_710692 [Hyaloraphidium curvatum]|nr:hypothetical protein DFJ74DRAFT_710692 [Hyaloraphidium curvatum]